MTDPADRSALSDGVLLDMLRLNGVRGLGPRLMTALLERFGTPGRVLAASGEELLSVEGVGPKLSVAITQARHAAEATRELARVRDLGIELILRDSSAYPPPLREICDPPPVLYCRGTYLPRDALAVAIVGSRRATLYGRQQAERFGAALARAGFTIVSGLARGIDAAAHRGALAAGGRTIAVCATGLANVYPPEHAPLAEEIVAAGAVLSESPLDREPLPGLFPQRNRIISGLARGVLIVEASRQSGALHTARHAQEQGREVFAIPGRIDSPESAGCHDLIRDGVTLVQSVDDILEELGPLPAPVPVSAEAAILTPRELALNEPERVVLQAVPTDLKLIDDLLAELNLEPSRVLATLTVLEMKRLVRRLPGGYVVRVSH
jgi:DNA processing protein